MAKTRSRTRSRRECSTSSGLRHSTSERASVVADVAVVEGDGYLLRAEKSEGGLGRSRVTVCHGGALSSVACWSSQTASYRRLERPPLNISRCPVNNPG